MRDDVRDRLIGLALKIERINSFPRRMIVRTGKFTARKARESIFWRKRGLCEDVMLPKLGKEVSLTYRKFKPADAVECLLMILENERIRIEKSNKEEERPKFTPESIKEIGRRCDLRLVEMDGRIVGVVGFYTYSDNAGIFDLNVESGTKGLGVGRFMIMKLLSELKKVHKTNKLCSKLREDSQRLFSRYFPEAYTAEKVDDELVEMTLDLTKIK